VNETHPPLFRRAVICVNGSSTDRFAVEYAVSLAKPQKASLVALHVVEIDWTLPIDASVAELSEEAQRVLDTAESTAERLGSALEPVLLQARDVGAAIVDEAAEQGADLLVLGLGYRMRYGGEFVIGRTVPYVFKNAPCAVIVVREPMPQENP
jgi:nucleotide-binding universal stress UspA family protein